MFVLLLGFTVYRTFKKAMGQWRKESETIRAAQPAPIELEPLPEAADGNDDMATHRHLRFEKG